MKSVVTQLHTSYTVFPVDFEEIKHVTGSDSKRVVVEINGKHSYHLAIQFSSEIGHYVYAGKTLLTETGLRLGDEAFLRFFNDETEFQFETPAELMELLALNAMANAQFESLTHGAKRGIFHYINKLKSPEKRVLKALFIIEKLENGYTSIQQMLKKN